MRMQMSTRVFSNRMRPDEVATELGIKVGTLAVWRVTRRYPLPWYKVGRNVFYKRCDVESFIESCRRDVSIADSTRECL